MQQNSANQVLSLTTICKEFERMNFLNDEIYRDVENAGRVRIDETTVPCSFSAFMFYLFLYDMISIVNTPRSSITAWKNPQDAILLEQFRKLHKICSNVCKPKYPLVTLDQALNNYEKHLATIISHYQPLKTLNCLATTINITTIYTTHITRAFCSPPGSSSQRYSMTMFPSLFHLFRCLVS